MLGLAEGIRVSRTWEVIRCSAKPKSACPSSDGLSLVVLPDQMANRVAAPTKSL
jgi:hypothetical protein